MFLCALAAASAVTNASAAQCTLTGGTPPISIFSTTGSPSLDRAFNHEAERLSRTFGVTPRLGVLDDRMASNAVAFCGMGPFGTVAFGLRLLHEELWRMDRGPAAIAGVLAHADPT